MSAAKPKACGCPAGSRKVSTKGRGRGWACVTIAETPGKGWFRPFVKATPCPGSGR